MAQTWNVAGKSPEETKSLLEKQIGSAEVPSFANISWQGNELKVAISKAGKSHFTMAILPDGTNSVIKEIDRSVAFVHRPFVSLVEKYVNDLMTKVSG